MGTMGRRVGRLAAVALVTRRGRIALLLVGLGSVIGYRTAEKLVDARAIQKSNHIWQSATAAPVPAHGRGDAGGIVPPVARPGPAVIVDIPALAGKSPSAVGSILGPPTKSETITNNGKPLPKKYYRQNQLEIVFVNGKADWFTVYGLEAVPFDASALTCLGFPDMRPDLVSGAVLRWEGLDGIGEVSVFPKENGGITYAYVLVTTRP
jgi:hypothetical protein